MTDPLELSVVPAATTTGPPVPVVVPFPPSAVGLPRRRSPAATVVVPRYGVFTPLNTRALLALFCVTALTFAPNGALTNVAPVPVPLLISAPVGLTAVVAMVIPFARGLLLFNRTSPVPTMPPVTENSRAVDVVENVVPAAFTVMGSVLTVSAAVLLLWSIAVTELAIPPVNVVVPAPLPLCVNVPAMESAPPKVKPSDPRTSTARLVVPLIAPGTVTSAVVPVPLRTVRLGALTVIAPGPVLSARAPPSVKSPCQICAFRVVIVVAALASSVVPAAIVEGTTGAGG